MMRYAGIVLLSVAILTLSGCKKINGQAHTYLTVMHPFTGEDVNLKLQLKLPPAGTPALSNGLYPGLVFVHGGGWGAGNRFDNGFDSEIVTAADKGYVAASVDYRLASKDADGRTAFPWPAQIQDVKCAVRWLKSRAGELRLDPERITVMGISAGGHLAAMAVETGDRPDLEAPECLHGADSRIDAAVVFSGVVDVETTWNESSMVASQLRVLGDLQVSTATGFSRLSDSARDALTDLDPLSAMGASRAPVLLVHPINDFLVPVDNARQYFRSLKDQARTACLLALDRGGHFTGPEGTEAGIFARSQMYEWLDRHHKGDAQTTYCNPAARLETAVVIPG